MYMLLNSGFIQHFISLLYLHLSGIEGVWFITNAVGAHWPLTPQVSLVGFS